MKKIAIIGANGQLGCDLVNVLQSDYEIVPLTHGDIEISWKVSCEQLKEIKPDVVINTAAFHDVPQCEKEPIKSFEVNAVGAFNLAQICKEIDAVLLHLSTDYVFDGSKKKPYVETDVARPLNAYGISKLASEQFIQYACPKHFIVRTCGLYGEHKCRAKERNFAELMISLSQKEPELKVVNDEFLTPTFTLDLAAQIRELVLTDQYGLYHITNKGSCSWYEFAVKIFELLGGNVKIIPVSAANFPSKVLRPGYSVLENRHLQDINLDHMRPWEEALEDYLGRVKLL